MAGLVLSGAVAVTSVVSANETVSDDSCYKYVGFLREFGETTTESTTSTEATTEVTTAESTEATTTTEETTESTTESTTTTTTTEEPTTEAPTTGTTSSAPQVVAPMIIYKNIKKRIVKENLTILFSCGKMKISTKKHRIISE